MKVHLRKPIGKIMLLFVLVILAVLLYTTYNTYGNWDFALKLRGKKVLAFIFVGIATSFSTITFQTVTQNHFLTPSILGLDSLYILIQTVLFFFFGTQVSGILSDKLSVFLLNLVLMVLLSSLLFLFILRKGKRDLFLLLMVGTILGTFFRSASTFLQVLMDPNEYAKLQGKLFASFNNVDINLVWIAGLFLILVVLYLWFSAGKLDVLHLGDDKALNLGIPVYRFQILLLLAVSTLVAASTALVGPVTFLGFIVANLTYQLMGTYRHRLLFIGSSLLSIFLLVIGQFAVEQLFKTRTTLSVVIEFVGGIYFIGKIIRERGSSQ